MPWTGIQIKVCLHLLIEKFYEQLGLDYRKNLTTHQFCWTPVLYSYENTEIWRACEYDGSQTNATAFQAIAQPSEAYKQATTIHTPKLEAYEEFPVVRAKRRPVLLLVPDPQPIDDELRGGGKINRHLCLVAPCYSVVDRLGKAKFSQRFLERVCRLEFPQFLFMPQSPVLPNDSLCRLDSIQHVFHNHLEPTQWRLSGEVSEIVHGQTKCMLTGEYSGQYTIARDILQGK